MDFKFPDIQAADELIAFEDIELILKALLSQTSIEAIEYDGILFPQWFHRITDIPTLKILKVRKTPTLGSCTRRSIPSSLSEIHHELRGTKLQQMHSLRVLHVSSLLAAEAMELAHAVCSLSNLEELYAGVSQEIRQAKALTIFLKSLFLANESRRGSQPQSPIVFAEKLVFSRLPTSVTHTIAGLCV